MNADFRRALQVFENEVVDCKVNDFSGLDMQAIAVLLPVCAFVSIPKAECIEKMDCC